MDKEQYYLDRLALSTGPAHEGQILIEKDDGTHRVATEAEILEAASFMPWVSEWLKSR